MIGATLAPGWYETPLEWFQQPNNYGLTPPALRAELRIEHADGSVEWVNTNKSWQAMRSNILHSELYDGESQDARQIWTDSYSSKIDQSAWKPVAEIEPAPVRIEAQDFPPIRVDQILEAKSLAEPKSGVFVYDFDQNFSGMERLRIQGPAGHVDRETSFRRRS